MKLQDLIYFKALAENESFTKTAEKFYVSQPSISIAVKRLESEFETVLLNRDRTSKSIELTPAGKILYQTSLHILNTLEATKNELEQINDQKVKLGIPPIIGGYLLPKLVPYLKDYSQSLEFVEGDGSIALFDMLKKKKVTTSIIGSDTPTIHASWVSQEPIAEDSFYICVANSHPLASCSSVTPSMLKNESFISLGEGYVQNKVFNNWAKKNNIDTSSVHYTNEIQTANSLVASGVGVSLLISLLVQDREDIVQIPLENAPKFYISLLTNNDASVSPIQEGFNKVLIKSIRNHFKSD